MKKVRFLEPGADQYLCCFNSDVFWVLCDCIYNIAKQIVDVKVKNIQKYENVCKIIVEKNTSVEKTRASFFKQNRHWIVTALSKVFYMHLSDWKMNCAVDVILIPRNKYTINRSYLLAVLKKSNNENESAQLSSVSRLRSLHPKTKFSKLKTIRKQKMQNFFRE